MVTKVVSLAIAMFAGFVAFGLINFVFNKFVLYLPQYLVEMESVVFACLVVVMIFFLIVSLLSRRTGFYETAIKMCNNLLLSLLAGFLMTLSLSFWIVLLGSTPPLLYGSITYMLGAYYFPILFLVAFVALTTFTLVHHHS